MKEGYTSDAQSLELTWPRTAHLLRQIAENYQRDSIIHDHESEIID
jgi:hypothetical protein